jgi:hypothetical protein
MRLALSCLRDNGAEADINKMPPDIGFALARRSLFDQALDIDSADLSPDEIFNLRARLWEVADAVPEPAPIWKIHDVWECPGGGAPLFPPSITAATLYLVRDPRDVAVSWAHFTGRDIDAAIGIMADKEFWVTRKNDRISRLLPQHYSSWSDHVESWLDRSGLNPLVIRYEDMARDMAAVLGRVAAALEWPAPSAAIAAAVAATGFDRLREQERRHGFSERPPKTPTFFRRGVAGGWRDTLTPEQAARIESDHGAVMARLGYL